MNVGVRGDDRAHDLATGNNDAGGNERVDRMTQAILITVDELCGWQGTVDHRHRRPVAVVQVEHRVHRDEVHVRLVVGVQRTNVAPVIAVAVGRTRHVVVLEVVNAALAALHEPRDDVASHVVLGIGVGRVLAQGVDQILRGEHVVAYSGGIDSSYLLKVALDTLGPDNVIAAVVNSEMFSNEEFDLALDLADQLGAPVLGLEMRELSDPRIAANTPNIWYYTKQLMYQTIKDSVTELGFKQLVDGNIMDDIDDFRPGIKARDEAGVRSVLQEAGLYKTEIRQLAKERGVSNWNKVPSCSVASRFPYGVKITSENVQRVFEGEEFLVGLGFEQVRVRVHGDLARIEVEEDHLLEAIQLHDKINDYMKKIGFTYVALDLAGYKYGRMNDALDEKTKEKIMAG